MPETDCVLATLDLQQLLDERGVSLSDAPLHDQDPAGALDALAPAAGLTGVPGSAGTPPLDIWKRSNTTKALAKCKCMPKLYSI